MSFAYSRSNHTMYKALYGNFSFRAYRTASRSPVLSNRSISVLVSNSSKTNTNYCIPKAGGPSLSSLNSQSAFYKFASTKSSTNQITENVESSSEVSTSSSSTGSSTSAAPASTSTSLASSEDSEDVTDKQHKRQSKPKETWSSHLNSISSSDTNSSWTYKNGKLGAHPSTNRSDSKVETIYHPTPMQRNAKYEAGEGTKIQHIISIRKVVKRRKSTKRRLFSVMVCVGNGAGAGGIGQGRAVTMMDAINKAFVHARQNMFTISTLNGRTLFSDQEYKFLSTTLQIVACRPGHGVVGGKHIHEMSRCFGINDLKVRVLGSQNPINVAQAFAGALKNQIVPADVANARGKILYNVEETYYGTSSKKSAVF